MKKLPDTNKSISLIYILFCFILIGGANNVTANQIDAGIFGSATQNNVVEVKIKPDFLINADQTISGILYTIRWSDPELVITNIGYIFPYNVGPQNAPIYYEGHYYVVFGSVPFNPVGTAIQPGEERIISTITFSGSACTQLELVTEVDWTNINNGNYYMELGGQDRTGIIYEGFAPMYQDAACPGLPMVMNCDAPPIELDFATPQGGTYSGEYVTYNVLTGQFFFVPDCEDPGSFTITYTYDDSGCVSTCDFVIEVQNNWIWTNETANRRWHDAGNWNRNTPPVTGLATNILIDREFANAGPEISTEVLLNQSSDKITIGGDLRLTLAPSGSLSVQNLDVSGSTHASGPVLIESTSSRTGSLIHYNDDIQAVVQLYVGGAENSWHLISSPVSAQDITNGFDDGSFFAWHEPAQTWVSFTNSEVWPTWNDANGSNDFLPYKGYLTAYPFVASNPQTKVFEGTLNQDEFSFALQRKAHPDDTFEGFNLLGNPYPSSIDWKEDAGWSGRDNLQQADTIAGGYNMWIWNDVEGNYGAHNSGSISDYSHLGVSRYIPPMQAFWLRAEVDEAVLSVSNNARAHSDQQWLKQNKSIPGLLSLAVSSDANPYRDEIIIEFGHRSDLGGAEKMFSMHQTAPGLYTEKHNSKWSISFLTNTEEYSRIPIGFKPGEEALYTITAPKTELSEVVMLEDLFTGSMHNLNLMPQYHFTAKPGEPEHRFMLHFKALGTDDIAARQPEVYYHAGVLSVVNTWKTETAVHVYDVNGRLLTEHNAVTGLNRYAFNPQPGMYLVTLKSLKSVSSTKVLIF